MGRAAELDPSNGPMQVEIGVLLSRANRLEPAEAAFERAAALSSLEPMAFRSWGHLLMRAGRLDEAVTKFEKAVALDPQDAAAHAGLGLANQRMGRTARAIEHYRRALALDPNHPARRNLEQLIPRQSP